MKNLGHLDRREVLVAMSAFAALGFAAEAGAETEPVLSQSETFEFGKLPVKTAANGNASRDVTHGTLTTGEYVGVHETALAPGMMPHPAHRHRNSEFIMVREGTVEFNNDGKVTRVGPGGMNFNASNVLHSMTNVGDTTAHYFVVEIGRTTGVMKVSE
jgi:quercetin dioxygenase-like cupin family protein